MNGKREFSLSSEKLNHLSEYEQSEYERDEIALLPHALNPLFLVLCLETSSRPESTARFEILLQNASGGRAHSAVSN